MNIFVVEKCGYHEEDKADPLNYYSPDICAEKKAVVITAPPSNICWTEPGMKFIAVYVRQADMKSQDAGTSTNSFRIGLFPLSAAYNALFS